MKTTLVSIFRLVTVCALGAQTLPAAVMFSAGTVEAGVGGNVSVPITVSGFADVKGFQFTLRWEEEVIQYTSTGSYGLPSMSSGSFGTFNVTSGTLTVSWDNDPAISLGDGSTVFAVNFSAIGDMGTRSDINFTGSPVSWEVFDGNLSPIAYGWKDGGVTVVPETANVALGVFGGLWVSAITLRWIARNRAARTAE